MKMIVDGTRSVLTTVRPFVLDGLANCGVALIRFAETGDQLEGDMLVVAALLGGGLGCNISHRTLYSEGDPNVLAAHCEGISFSGGLVPAFALGCSTAAQAGGETRIYDGRRAARLVGDRYPKIAGATIRYESLGNTGEAHTYSLIAEDKVFGNVLRYRGDVSTNRLPADLGLPPKDFYRLVDDVLAECLVISHHWERGDLLFVDNRWTLHDRLPFVGPRRMVRVRYGDAVAAGLKY